MDSFRYKIIRKIQLRNNNFFVLIYGFIIEDFIKYGKFILLKGNYDTGTGWSKVGDETGFYNTDKVYEIWIEGKVKPPKISTSFAGYQKVYLCKVEEVTELKNIKFLEKHLKQSAYMK